MPYEIYEVCVKYTLPEDAIAFPVYVSVGDEVPEENSEDDQATFYHFDEAEWEEVCKMLDAGEPCEVEGEFTVENHGLDPLVEEEENPDEQPPQA